VPFRALRGALVCSILILLATAACAAAANGSSAGGVAAGPPPATHAARSHRPLHAARSHQPLHIAPVTSTSTDIAYSGPVYERTATGQIVPYQTATAATELKAVTGGAVGALADSKPDLLVPGHLGRIVDGLAAAPMLAPSAVQKLIWAGNQIIGLPYVYGGGHASFESPGYDCSGTVSFALHGAHLLSSPEDSSEFEQWGSHGVGRWVTVFTNPGHAYMTVAGLRLDTSAADDPSNQQGPRWRPLRPANEGFGVRHPTGL
jgi:cell wall-associated NlpC family hydrolase